MATCGGDGTLVILAGTVAKRAEQVWVLLEVHRHR